MFHSEKRQELLEASFREKGKYLAYLAKDVPKFNLAGVGLTKELTLLFDYYYLCLSWFKLFYLSFLLIQFIKNF